MPSCVQRERVSLTSSALTSSNARFAPLPAKWIASERPMPRPAPVTRIVLPRTFTAWVLLFHSGNGDGKTLSSWRVLHAPSAAAAARLGPRRFLRLFGFVAALVGGLGREGREHRGLHLGPHFHVLVRHLGEWRHRRLECLGHLRLHHALLTQQRPDALLEVRG